MLLVRQSYDEKGSLPYGIGFPKKQYIGEKLPYYSKEKFYYKLNFFGEKKVLEPAGYLWGWGPSLHP